MYKELLSSDVTKFFDDFSRSGTSFFDRYVYSVVPGVGSSILNKSYFGADNTGNTFNALHAGPDLVNGWLAMIYPKVMVNNPTINGKSQFAELTWKLFSSSIESGACLLSRWDYNVQRAYQMVYLNNGGVQLFRLIAWDGVTPRTLHSSAPGFVADDIVRCEINVNPGVSNDWILKKNGSNIATGSDVDASRPTEGIPGLTLGPDFINVGGSSQWDAFTCGKL